MLNFSYDHLVMVSADLVYPAGDGVVQDAGDEEGLHVSRLNVQLSGYEGDLYPGVGTNQLYQHLYSE
jgi:hypothetical protein